MLSSFAKHSIPSFSRLLGFTEISTASLTAKVEAGERVAVDYFAHWCGPCKKLGPHFEELADDETFKGISFYKMDIDKNYDCGIRSVPTVRVFKEGGMVDEMVGFSGPDPLRELIERI